MAIIEVSQRLGTTCADPVDLELELDHLQREKGRLRVQAASGDEVRIFLDRGNPLRVGEILRSACGKNIRIIGATETVLTAFCKDWQTFSRACYHLGNRHVKLEVGECWLRITPDHVLEEMLQQLGLTTQIEQAIFVPETGAYSHGHHHH